MRRLFQKIKNYFYGRSVLRKPEVKKLLAKVEEIEKRRKLRKTEFKGIEAQVKEIEKRKK